MKISYLGQIYIRGNSPTREEEDKRLYVLYFGPLLIEMEEHFPSNWSPPSVPEVGCHSKTAFESLVRDALGKKTRLNRGADFVRRISAIMSSVNHNGD